MKSDAPAAPPGAPEDVPAAVVQKKSGFSLVWIVPILAAGIGAWLWWDALQNRGPEITISFSTADGLEAGKTAIRFKSVEVGTIETVALAPDLSGVVATARMGPRTEALLHGASRFWVVRPRIGLEGISGLGTLLSGAYVELDPTGEGPPSRSFTGLEIPPETPADAPGLKLRLSADTLGSLSVGSPVSHHGVVVGKVEAYRLLGEAEGLEVDVYIEPEFAPRVHENTRFWNASGIDVTFGAEGVKLTSASFISLLSGGLEFDTPREEAATPVAKSGATYPLYADRTASREVFTQTRDAVLYFAGSVRGLSPGAPVEFRGIRLGTVTSFGLENKTIDKALTRVVIAIEPERIGREFGQNESAQQVVNRLVGAGLRARLAVSSLLTGALYVDIVVDPGGAAVLHNVAGELEIPTEESTAEALAASAEKIPAIVADAQRAVAALAEVAASAEMQQLPGDVHDVSVAARDALQRANATLAAIEELLAEQGNLQVRVADAIDEISSGMRSIRQLADTLERQPEALIKGKSQSPGDR